MSAQPDPAATIRGQEYHRLLILAAVVGLFTSLAAWCFLTLIPLLQDAVFIDLPQALGFVAMPAWWPVPILAAAGLITALVISRMPGGGGGVPAEGLSSGVTQPSALPGVLIAAVATLGLGLVLGPSSPVIALGMGLGLLIVRRLRPDAPVQAQNVIAISGAFASFAMVFNNPVIAAIILVEAIGIGGAMAPVIILPGLMAAGIGGLVYLGLGSLTGLDTSTYALKPLDLQPLANLTLADFGWTIVAAVVATLVAVAVVRGGRHVAGLVKRNYLLLVPVVGVIVAVLALIFAQSTGQPSYAILFSGSRAMSPIVAQAGTLSVATLLLLVLLKEVAWSLSMGSFRGGPVFPAIFLGLAGGLLASHLPGFGASAAVPAVGGIQLTGLH